MSLKYIALTCSGDTNDTIISINGNPVNKTITQYITDNPSCYIDNGGVTYYPDLVTPNLNDGDAVVLATTGSTTVQLTGGVHAPQRPR